MISIFFTWILLSMTDISFLALIVTTLVGFGSLFRFLHVIWKQLSSQTQELKLELKTDIQDLRKETKTEIHELKTEMASFRSEVKKDFHRFEVRFETANSALRDRIDVLVDTLAIRFIEDLPRKKKRLPG
ncbi:hypothetical protein LEP1GSC016_3401 [Leptospira borgpetersenii serovar Hardjo-bovis str. Sponselee]|uniref:DUF1640 domain-containing protein n=3 Tax=Leptospira borgpetersenii TaxID=174 RepID=Q04SM3_LEPBJ|nr:Hypothetical protein LBJ_1524 [Leptospira borgpetersenii serovar Hardjo-bovis str. JB197]ABJ79195.1 Hypothetical protein LBL_1748 [Leptospira borgpetersenii serovar Hardjo-bovis str. L550]EMJ83237.1 hypothetical protein LEP1GSC016_3401 [Leptospira borgpetersenii serovar Hardjo-bovis str. Sponselee]